MRDLRSMKLRLVHLIWKLCTSQSSVLTNLRCDKMFQIGLCFWMPGRKNNWVSLLEAWKGFRNAMEKPPGCPQPINWWQAPARIAQHSTNSWSSWILCTRPTTKRDYRSHTWLATTPTRSEMNQVICLDFVSLYILHHTDERVPLEWSPFTQKWPGKVDYSRKIGSELQWRSIWILSKFHLRAMM